jgi:hypothetical protein
MPSRPTSRSWIVMKRSPIALRLASGSSSPARAARNSLRVDHLKVLRPELAKVPHNLLALGLAHEARVDIEEVHLVVGEDLEEEGARDGRVDAARDEEEGVVRPNLGADPLGHLVDVGFHAPLPRGRADADDEVLEYAHAALAVAHLGMELQAPDLASDRATRPVCRRRRGEHLEAGGGGGYRVAVAHPARELGRHASEERVRRAGRLARRANRLARRSGATRLAAVLALAQALDLSAEVEGHALDAVAYAEDGQPAA